MKKTLQYLLLILVCFIFSMDVFAYPEGEMVAQASKPFFKTTAGKLLIVTLAVLIVPIIMYLKQAGNKATTVINNALSLIGVNSRNPHLRWATTKEVLKKRFEAIHAAWTKMDEEKLKSMMTAEYFAVQKTTNLDHWKENGLINKFRLHEYKEVKPVFMSTAPEEITLKVYFKVKAQEALSEEATGKIVRGSDQVINAETIYSFVFRDYKWLLDGIENIELAAGYIAQTKKANPEALKDGFFKRKQVSNVTESFASPVNA